MLKDKLREAIESRDWELACDFYESMFGEVIEMPPGNPEYLDINAIKNKALEIIEECSAIDMGIKPQPQPQAQPQPQEEDQVEEKKSETFSTGSTSPETDTPKMKFLSSEEFDLPEDDMDGYAEAVEKAHKKRKKTYREEYQSNMKVCPSCNREFDFNKEYPAGLLESSREPKCNKCRAIPTS